MEIRKVAVIGGGRMGRQIGLNAAISGYEVKVTDSIPAVLTDIENWKEEYLAGRIAKGKMTEEKVAEVKSRFALADSIEAAVCDADLVIEAVLERIDLKKEVLAEICKYAPAAAIIGTNSSRIPSSTFLDSVTDGSKLCNLHYNNPALVMKAVEIQQHDGTSEDTVESLKAFCISCGKVPIHIRKEVEGMICSKILGAINRTAYYLVENGYCTIEDVDNACEYGLNHPMGPFRLNDLTGLDVSFDVQQKFLAETGEKVPGYELLKAKVEKGELGKKTGKGWYTYDK